MPRIDARYLLASLEVEPSVHRAYAGIALPNAPSVALHERLGFELAGTFGEVGFKLGKFWDVSWCTFSSSGIPQKPTGYCEPAVPTSGGRLPGGGHRSGEAWGAG